MYGTREEIKKIIKMGAVTVDSVVVDLPGHRLKETNVVVVDQGRLIDLRHNYYVFAINKPGGVVSKPEYKSKFILDYLPDVKKVIFIPSSS